MHDNPTLPEKEFRSYAPGFGSDKNVSPADWNSSTWQLKNRITTLAQLEEHLTLAEEERDGALLSGNKLTMAITPHYFNLIDPEDSGCPIPRQVIPRIEETLEDPDEMSAPCGEDSHMPVQGLVHRYPESLRQLLPLLHAQPCRLRRGRAATAHRVRGRLPLPRTPHGNPRCAALGR